MPIQKPEEVLELVAQTINSGDVDVQMAIYEPDAYFILSRARPSDWHPGHPGTLHWLLGNETNVNFGFAVLQPDRRYRPHPRQVAPDRYWRRWKPCRYERPDGGSVATSARWELACHHRRYI